MNRNIPNGAELFENDQRASETSSKDQNNQKALEFNFSKKGNGSADKQSRKE
jgi:hypothetical protein